MPGLKEVSIAHSAQELMLLRVIPPLLQSVLSVKAVGLNLEVSCWPAD